MDGPSLARVATAGGVEDDYFSRNPAPKSIERYAELSASFVQQHARAGRRVALITSGGTTVPLENQTVRFIDNFSAGTRGATSAEYFLQAGYAVVFLHRRFSLLPYARHYSHSTNCFLDFMAEDEGSGRVYARDEYQQRMRAVLRKYKAARDEDALLLLPFTTVNEYLWALRETAYALQYGRSSALLYLAAAVSDFFVPRDRLAEHKIQSAIKEDHGAENETTGTASKQKLVIDLDMVPKFLKQLVEKWAPNAMIISFKLETDPSILISKARAALERYSHHLVIGNVLATRSFEVVFVTPDRKENWIRIPSHRRVKSISAPPAEIRQALASATNAKTGEDDNQSILDGDALEIESIIVPECVRLHDSHMQKAIS